MINHFPYSPNQFSPSTYNNMMYSSSAPNQLSFDQNLNKVNQYSLYHNIIQNGANPLHPQSNSFNNQFQPQQPQYHQSGNLRTMGSYAVNNNYNAQQYVSPPNSNLRRHSQTNTYSRINNYWPY